MNKTLVLLLKIIATAGPLTQLGIEAYSEIKALSGMTDDEINDVWIKSGEANAAAIARRRLEIESVK